MTEGLKHRIIIWFLCIIMYAEESQAYRNFVLGGLFPVHQKGEGGNSCGVIMKEKGIQRMEAMLYAIEKINREQNKWGFTLEAHILDTCSSDSHALSESLKFLEIECNSSTMQRVTGVIGAANSPVSESVATIFHLFRIPQISYASTSKELDDVVKYPYFFRVVPSDSYQVIAIVELLEKLKWTYLSTVVSDGDYGEDAVRELQNHINSNNLNICFGVQSVIPREADKGSYEDVINQLLKKDQPKAVLVFLNEDKLRKLLLAASELGVSNRKLFWLGSDSWGKKERVAKGIEHVVEGAITILPLQFEVLAGFNQYFTSLKLVAHQHENRWFREFWESHFGCSFSPSSESRCTGNEDLTVNYTQESLVPMVVDAVYVMAHALKKLCAKEPDECRDDRKPPSGHKLLSYIENVTMRSSRGHDMMINFDSKRSVPVNYTIQQYRKNAAGLYQYTDIGSWNKDGLKLKENNVGTEPSICSEPCKPGWERNNHEGSKCCWTCRRCQENHYVSSPTGRCSPCEKGNVLNADATACIYAEPQYFGKDKASSWSTIPLVLSIIGAICCFVMYMAFLIYHNTPIIMASGRELCHFIFLGVFLCYCFTFVMVAEPTEFVCGLVRVGLGLGLTVCYSAIFTKTNRISRIFNRSVRSAKRPRYVTPKSQLVICLCLVMIELTLSTIWLLLEPPVVTKEPLGTSQPLFISCQMRHETVCLALGFSVVLIILCTFYAYKTRKIPENFNEAKYISFVMYSTCIIWMAFVPTYFGTPSDNQVKCTLLTLGVSLSGTVILVCIFVPKLYIVIFQPQKNVRFPTTTNSATAAYTGPVRFVKTSHATNTLTPETKLSNPDKIPPVAENEYATPKKRTLEKRKVSQV